MGGGVLVVSKTVNAVLRETSLATSSFNNRRCRNYGRGLGVATPSIVRRVRLRCLGTNTSVVRAGAFNTADVILTSCSLRRGTCRLGGVTIRVTERTTSHVSAPR